MRERYLRDLILPLAAGLVFSLAMASPAAAVINATSADDICEPNEDPCVIVERVNVSPAMEGEVAVLDFGLREVQTVGGGFFNVGNNSVEFSAGRWRLGGSSNSIVGNAGGFGAYVTVIARGTCSDDAEQNCVLDSDCAGEEARCSGGDGRIDVSARINVNANEPGGIELRSAGDMTIAATLDANGTATASDGGKVDLSSSNGTVNVAGLLATAAGGQGTGGDITIAAGVDVLVQTAMALTGGDGDGGSVLIEAGRDVIITNNIDCNAAAGAGSGGFIDVTAERDLVITGTGAASPVKIFSDGSRDADDDFAGDGGDHSYIAGRNIVINEFVILTSSGARPDGFGGEIAFDAGGNVEIAGDIVASGKGADGEGGTIDLFASGDLTVLAEANFDTTAGDGAGTVEAASNGPMNFGGSHDLRALVASGFGGDAFVTSDADMDITGTFVTNGDSAVLFFSACRIDLTSTGFLNNVAEDGTNELEVGESVRISAGGQMNAPDGENVLTYRDSEKPPVILGAVTPDPGLVVKPTLPGCPVCGNAELDKTESCDDGNTVGGDGCGALCQFDSCVASTPDFPNVPICDDGKECTVDSCSRSLGICTNIDNCDDGVTCTSDRCVGDACVNTPVNSRCDNGVFCDGAETCDAVSGCLFGPAPNCGDSIPCTIDTCDETSDSCVHTPNNAVCNDGVFCNGPEICTVGVGCQGVAAVDCSDDFSCTADSCDELNDRCVNAPNDNLCPSGPCSDPVCSPVVGCRKVDNGTCSTTTSSTVPFNFECGDANLNGAVNASDALLTLKTAVGAATCDKRVCDFDGDGNVRASDALSILRAAVGLPVTPNCNFDAGGLADGRYVITSTTTTTSLAASTTTTLP